MTYRASVRAARVVVTGHHLGFAKLAIPDGSHVAAKPTFKEQ
jgi:hypothetical protein